jgi:hypothetical protein
MTRRSMTSAISLSRCQKCSVSNGEWCYDFCLLRFKETFSCATACCSSSPSRKWRRVLCQPVDASFHQTPLNVAL